MRVIEIFDSIDGEGIFVGGLATFIRLAGCNLRCSYCDTAYALSANSGIEMQTSEILDTVQKIGNRHITLTGGEPLIHYGSKYLIQQLAGNGFFVNIETNGSVDISEYQNENTVITMDYKTESSGECDKMRLENLELLREQDVLKIVCKESDFPSILDLLKKNRIKSYIYISPIFGKVEPEKLVEFVQTMRNAGVDTEKIRVQLQLHKIIWNPEQRGV